MRVFADTLYAAVGWDERGSVVHNSLGRLVDAFPLQLGTVGFGDSNSSLAATPAAFDAWIGKYCGLGGG